MKMKKLCAALVAMSVALGVGASTDVQAMTRIELADFAKGAGSSLRHWNKDAASFQALASYVQRVKSWRNVGDYIPPEDRIAVFDLDGTLISERMPSSFEWLMYVHRVLEDPSYIAAPEDVACAQAVRDAMENGTALTVTGEEVARSQAAAFAGMTMPEYNDYVRQFLDTPAPGLAYLHTAKDLKAVVQKPANLKRGEAFFLPMIEVIRYLQANDFDIWVVTGTDRAAARVMLDEVLPIQRDHIIGKDVQTVASGQGETSGADYDFNRKSDVLVRGLLFQRDIRMNKVSAVVREIGRQPVLAFGNSMGDASLFNYTLARNKYKAMAFAVLCDDTESDTGSQNVADTMREACTANGWTPISMRDDWKTVYGKDVKNENAVAPGENVMDEQPAAGEAIGAEAVAEPEESAEEIARETAQ